MSESHCCRWAVGKVVYRWEFNLYLYATMSQGVRESQLEN